MANGARSVLVVEELAHWSNGHFPVRCAQLAAGFLTMEAMRYLTGSEAPVAAAEYHVLELADGMTTSRARWAAHPDCSSCRIAEGRR